MSGLGLAAPLALTMGDPAGIGPDIALVSWLKRDGLRLPVFAVFGDGNVLRARARQLGLEVAIEIVTSLEEAADIFGRALPVVSVGTCGEVRAGVASAGNAAITVLAIEAAVSAVIAGTASAIVTNPIAKSVLYEAGFGFPGHTEFLAHLAGRAFPGEAPVMPVMMLASPELRVVPTTIHIPLADVPVALTAELLMRTIEITARALTADFGIPRPRIAVAGLNPHAGEGATIGHEERDLIAPVIAELRVRGIDVSGPRAADTLFHAEARAAYDAVVAMYHDQALIPIKTLAFDTGVNVTLGLPFVRTSPDHGTAFGIAGSGQASPSSLIEALRLAQHMAASRAASRASQ